MNSLFKRLIIFKTVAPLDKVIFFEKRLENKKTMFFFAELF